MSMLDIALANAARGWYVFPCLEGEKEPRTRSGFRAATLDRATIKRWWREHEYNIGIWTGASDLLVLDLDLKVPKKMIQVDEFSSPREIQDHDKPVVSGYSTLLELQREYMDFRTYTVITPRNGLHMYFRYGGHELRPTVNLYPGIDLRCGGSYVVGAGSKTSIGTYEVVDDLDVNVLPTWLERTLLRAQSVRAHPSNTSSTSEPTFYEREFNNRKEHE